jgi:hypothetical protein
MPPLFSTPRDPRPTRSSSTAFALSISDSISDQSMWASTLRHSAECRRLSLALSEGERGLWSGCGLDCPPTAAGDRQQSAPNCSKPSPPSCRLNHLPEIDSAREENEAAKGDTIDAHRSLQHTSASVSVRQHTSAYVSVSTRTDHCSIRQRPSASVSIRQHTRQQSVTLSMRTAHCSIRQHTSASVSIRQHPSAYVSIRQRMATRKGTIRSSVLLSPRCASASRHKADTEVCVSN